MAALQSFGAFGEDDLVDRVPQLQRAPAPFADTIGQRMRCTASKMLFRLANVGQVHIVGCSRSGTTLLHAAMTAFENAALHPCETRAEQPVLSDRLTGLAYFRRARLGWRERKLFVTKRGAAWFARQQVEALLARVTHEDAGVILMVRDPRDVLLSRHANGPDGAYVSPDHWAVSIEAGDAVERALQRVRPVMVLRYEDLIQQPRTAERAIIDMFGARLRPGAAIDRVRASIGEAGAALDPSLAIAMHGVRDFSLESVGRWRTSSYDPTAELSGNARSAPVFRRFMARHDYA